MNSKEKFSKDEIKQIKLQLEKYAERFLNNVNLFKVCQSFPQLNYCMNGRAQSKTECFQALQNFLLEQQDSQPFEILEKHLKEQRHWIRRDIFQIQEKDSDKEEENKEMEVVLVEEKFTENEKDSTDLDQMKIPDVKERIEMEPTAAVLEKENREMEVVLVEEKVTENEKDSTELDEMKIRDVKEMMKLTPTTADEPEIDIESQRVDEKLPEMESADMASAEMPKHLKPRIYEGSVDMRLIVLVLLNSLVLIITGICISWFSQSCENIYQVKEVAQIKKTLMEEPIILNIFSDNELDQVADACQRNAILDEGFCLICSLHVMKVVNVKISKDPKTGDRADHNLWKEIDKVDHNHLTTDGFGRNTCNVNIMQDHENSCSLSVEQDLETSCSINGKQELENSTANTCPNNLEDASSGIVMNVPGERPKPNPGLVYSDAIQNTESHSTLEKNKDTIIRNVIEVVANNRTRSLAARYIMEGSNFGKQDHFSIKSISMADDGKWLERNQFIILLTILLFSRMSICAWMLYIKKQKRQRVHHNQKRIRSESGFLRTGPKKECSNRISDGLVGQHCLSPRYHQGSSARRRFLWNRTSFPGRSCSKAVLLCSIVLFQCFSSTGAAPTPNCASPEVQNVTAKVNESLSLHCDGAVSANFTWIRYSGRQEKLHDSRKIKNDTNTPFAVFPNGTLVLKSAQVSDTAVYSCRIYCTDKDLRQIVYNVHVKTNSTEEKINSTEEKIENSTTVRSEVKDSKLLLFVIIGFLCVSTAAAGFIFVVARKLIKGKGKQRQSTSDDSEKNDIILLNENGVPNGNAPVELPHEMQNTAQRLLPNGDAHSSHLL